MAQSEQVFHFAQTEAQLGRQEINVMVRVIGGMQDTSVDISAGTMTVRGTAAQLGLAQWLFTELDQASGAAARGMRQYEVAGDSVAYVRAFFLAHTSSPRDIQETVNALRSIGEIQRIAAYTSNSVIVVRGSYDQAELASWLVPLLDRPGGVQPAAAPLEYHYNDSSHYPATAVRVLRLAHATTPQAMQEVVNAVRSIAEVQRVIVNSTIATMTIRSTPVQAALTAWIVQQVDQPAASRSAPAVAEYPPGLSGLLPPPARAASDETVKIAALAHTRTAEALQGLVNRIRSTVQMSRIVYATDARSLVLRGTAAQMAAAERLIQEADR
jgi:hypothetical protein